MHAVSFGEMIYTCSTRIDIELCDTCLATTVRFSTCDAFSELLAVTVEPSDCLF